MPLPNSAALLGLALLSGTAAPSAPCENRPLSMPRIGAEATMRHVPAKQHAPISRGRVQGLPLPDCNQIRASGKVGGALVEAFYARYPKALAAEASVEKVPLDAAALDNVVQYLVCTAAATDYDPVVAENGLALFASKRHGAAARRTLSAFSRSRDPAAGAARRFKAQISGYLRRPG